MDLPPNARLPVMTEGLRLIASNVTSKHADAECLFATGRYTSAYLLNGFASEEATKALMLLDAVRVGWKPDKEVRHLLRSSFYDHHSRLMYAYVYQFPAHLDRDEIGELIDGERDAYVVDGFEGWEYVFRNTQLAQREGQMYVDYCVDAEGQGEWTDPADWGSPSLFGDGLQRRAVIDLLASLDRLGVLTVPGLKAVVRAWRGVTTEVTWQELRQRNRAVLSVLAEAGALAEHIAEDAHRIISAWHMPLVGMDLTENRNMTLAQAHRRRTALQEAFSARECGFDDNY